MCEYRRSDPSVCPYCGSDMTYEGTAEDGDGDEYEMYWCENPLCPGRPDLD